MYKIIKFDLHGVEQTHVQRDNGDGSFTSFAAQEDNSLYQTFKKDLADGAQLQDAEGNVIDGIAYLKELV
jgi:hypothetical protein